MFRFTELFTWPTQKLPIFLQSRTYRSLDLDTVGAIASIRPNRACKDVC